MMKTLTLCALSAAVLALSACDARRDDGTTVGQKIDQAVTKTESSTADATQKMKEAGSQMGQSVSDATITAAVNADLAKDPELSALRINVDTRDGRVALYGSAPSEEAKQRAEKLALAEKGVVAVDNKLAVEKR
jgi:hyperosmotically inducible periplasmic protein